MIATLPPQGNFDIQERSSIEEQIPAVSIVIPIYNMEKYLARCLDSVLEQTYQNYEVIMVDDGSTDNSRQIAMHYTSDGRFTYVFQENSGVSAARNKGLEAAKGEWISFVDPDDYFTREHLEILLGSATTETDIISCCCRCSDSNDTIHFFKGNCAFGEGSCRFSKNELLLELMDTQYKAESYRRTAIGVPWAKLYRRSFLIENGLRFDVRLFRMQDNIFNMFAFDKCREFLYVDTSLYIYNVEHINAFGRKYNARIKDYMSLVLQLRWQYLTDRSLLDNAEIYRIFCNEVLRNTDSMLNQYFLHSKNRKTLTERREEIKACFSQEPFTTVLQDSQAVSGFINGKKTAVRVRIKMLASKQYAALIILDSAVEIGRNWRRKIKSGGN